MIMNFIVSKYPCSRLGFFQKPFNSFNAIQKNRCVTRQGERRMERGGLLELVGRKTLRRGVLIAIEGIDGAGKTTQAKLLARELVDKGYSVQNLHEPTDGRWGKKIKELAKNGRHKTKPETELEFFYFDRLEDVKDNIKPSLEEKQIVVMDRYYFSSVAYQGARNLDPAKIETKNEKIAPIPDITIILDLEPEVALKRIRQKRNTTPNHFERKKYLQHVRAIFLDHFGNRPNVKIVDGDDRRSIEMITSEIWEIVEPIIKAVEET